MQTLSATTHKAIYSKIVVFHGIYKLIFLIPQSVRIEGFPKKTMRMSKKHIKVLKQFLIELTGGIVIVYAMLGLALLFGGCKTVERENIVTKTDTVRIYSQHKDSVVYRDSVFVHLYERGDTVYHITERWNVEYRDRIHTDTVYKVREVAQQNKDVTEKKEPWYDDFLTKVLLCLLAGAVLVGAIKMTNNKA